MVPSDPKARGLQQQPSRENNQQQQQAGSSEFQSKPSAQAGQQPPGQQQQGGQQMGEGSYEATRDYQKNIKEYLEKADVEADAEAAKPRSESEARDIEQAEREARSHSKGEH